MAHELETQNGVASFASFREPAWHGLGTVFTEEKNTAEMLAAANLAQEKHGDGLKEYRASEGRILEVPYKGDINTTIKDYLGSIRSYCTYIGAATLKEASKRTTFILVNNQISAVYVGGKTMNKYPTQEQAKGFLNCGSESRCGNCPAGYICDEIS